MSTTRSINPGLRTIVRPQKVVKAIENRILNDPTEEAMNQYRSDGWGVAFETYQVVAMPNGGIKKYHFVRLEKETPKQVSIFRPQ